MTTRTHADREILSEANQKGAFSKLAAFFRLSGPGWLQSAITLGGGSLGSALYLGVLGGSRMLWLELVAIIVGVIMLSAIAYVTLSTRVRPYQAINQHVNPVLGVGWITATILANMIWILPQFALCFETLQKNLLPETVSDTPEARAFVSLALFVFAFIVVVMSFRPGWMSRMFDYLLKLMVGLIVVCFVAVIVYLARQGEIDLGSIWKSLIPDFSHWNKPAPEIAGLIGELPDQWKSFWQSEILDKQQAVIIGTTATAVGINMTFLLPYSMLARGWDKPFRGLARFDLVTALAIPFIIVTGCIILASAHAFHARADANFLSDDVTLVQQSKMFEGAMPILEKRFEEDRGEAALAKLLAGSGTDNEGDGPQGETKSRTLLLAEYATTLSQGERKLAATLVKPDTNQLAQSLEPLLGERSANLVFGLGAFAMGFSTIVILMLINGYAFAEVLGSYDNTGFRTLGSLMAGGTGFCWFLIWTGASKTWLIIVASTFGAILLPIAYLAFFLLMNNRKLLGSEKPRGLRMGLWNVLMLIGVVAAIAQAWLATSLRIRDPETGGLVLGAVVTFLVLALVGFSATSNSSRSNGSARPDASGPDGTRHSGSSRRSENADQS